MGHSRSFYSSQFLSDCFQPMFHWWVRYSRCFPGICLWTLFPLKTCLLSKISNPKKLFPQIFQWDSQIVSVKNLETKTAQLVQCLPAKSRPKLQRFWRAKRFLCMQGFGAWPGVYDWRCQDLDHGSEVGGWRVGVIHQNEQSDLKFMFSWHTYFDWKQLDSWWKQTCLL